MYMTESGKQLRGLGFILSLISSIVSAEYFKSAVYAACPCSPAEGTAEWRIMMDRWWPVRIISLLASMAVAALFFEIWQRILARWMKPRKGGRP
jgi:hypothetical protein